MREIIINDNNLKDEDISEKVIRVKGLMINSKGKILLAHNNNTYQFPGRHLEENENMDDCIVREIKEETGIDLEVIEEDNCKDNQINKAKIRVSIKEGKKEPKIYTYL